MNDLPCSDINDFTWVHAFLSDASFCGLTNRLDHRCIGNLQLRDTVCCCQTQDLDTSQYSLQA